MKKLSEISSEEFAELIIFIDKKVLGKTKYPHPDGLLHYRDEVIQSIKHIKDGDARKLKGISHFVEIDVTGLDVIELRKNTFLIINTKDLDVSKRIVKSGRSCG